MKKIILLALIVLSYSSTKAQLSYEAYKASYKPHYNTTIDKSETKMWDAIKTLNNTSPSELGNYLKGLYGSTDQNDLLIMARILTNCKRELIGQALDVMNLTDAQGTLSKMNAEWQKELMYFVAKDTYHALAKSFEPIKTYKASGDHLSFNEELNETYINKLVGCRKGLH